MRINLKQRGTNAKKKIGALLKNVSLRPHPRKTSSVNPQLLKLEREIGGIADRIHNKMPTGQPARNTRVATAGLRGSTTRLFEIAARKFASRMGGNVRVAIAKLRATITRFLDITHKFASKTVENTRVAIAKLRGAIARLVEITARKLEIIGRKFASGYTYLKVRVPPAAASTGRVMNVALRGTILSRKSNPPRRIKHEIAPKKTEGKKSKNGAMSGLEAFVIAAFLALVCVCSAIIVVLFLQLRQAKNEISGWQKRLSEVNARLNQVENKAQRKDRREPISPPEHASNNQVHNKIALSDEDMKVVRQYIRVLPSKSPGKAKIHLGDKVSNAVPVPDDLIDQMPKLRGARFSIDQNGAIVILGAGSNRADAIIPPQ